MDEGPAEFDTLWDYDQPAETERRFRSLLPALGANTSWRAELLTQISRAQGLQRRFAEAQATLDSVETLLPDLPLRPRIRYLLERGRVLNSDGDPTAARPFFMEAFRLAEAEPQEAFFAIDAAHMLAIISPEEALAWNQRALALADSATEARARNWRGSLLNNMGWAYHEQGDFTEALRYFEAALAFRRQQGRASEIRIARWCVARVRRDLGQMATALDEQRQLLAEFEAIGERSGYVYEEIGECLLAMGDAAGSRANFALAYELLSADPWLAANEPERLRRLRLLAQE